MSSDTRWHLEDYEPTVDDAPKGGDDVCTGQGDPAEDDEDGRR